MNQFIEEFPEYLKKWDNLHAEYRRTPNWRFIHKQRVLNKLSKLTKQYAELFKKESDK